MTDRITRLELFSVIVHAVAKRSTCLRRKVGALIVLEGRILSTGYAGSPAGTPHCLDVGCLIDETTGGCVRTQHAEANAIVFAARKGIAIEGAEMYATCTPCLMCAKMIINSGIIKITAFDRYREPAAVELLESVNIRVEVLGDQ